MFLFLEKYRNIVIAILNIIFNNRLPKTSDLNYSLNQGDISIHEQQ